VGAVKPALLLEFGDGFCHLLDTVPAREADQPLEALGRSEVPPRIEALA